MYRSLWQTLPAVWQMFGADLREAVSPISPKCLGRTVVDYVAVESIRVQYGTTDFNDSEQLLCLQLLENKVILKVGDIRLGHNVR